MQPKTNSIVALCCRVVIATTFIFSGFVKSVDPYGTAIKVGEYLSALGLGELLGLTTIIAVMLCSGELMLGLVVLFRVRPKESSLMMLLAMSFFTLTTLWIAIWNPVSDCGCFGDAIKLSNWQTFFKNLTLLPISIFLFRYNWKLKIRWNIQRLCALAAIAVVSFGLCIYSLYYLPPIDFLPYKLGVNIIDPSDKASDHEVKTTLIYKNIQTGETQEFTLDDTEWQDSGRWEFIDAITTDIVAEVDPAQEFAIFDGEPYSTKELLDNQKVMMIGMWDAAKPLSNVCVKAIEQMIDQKQQIGYKIIGITPTPFEKIPQFRIGKHNIKIYNIDATTLKTMLRARVGVIELNDGVIVGKYSCRGL